MLKLLCSGLAALAALPLIGVERLTPWASMDPKNGSGIEIISRVNCTADNFADGRPTKQDDWIVVNCSGATLPASAPLCGTCHHHKRETAVQLRRQG